MLPVFLVHGGELEVKKGYCWTDATNVRVKHHPLLERPSLQWMVLMVLGEYIGTAALGQKLRQCLFC